MPRQQQPKPLCAWCQTKPVRLRRHTCCSLSCASQKRWADMELDGRLGRVIEGRQAAYKNERTQRVLAEIAREFERLGINEANPNGRDLVSLKRLYVRARNAGYHAGYMARTRRER